MHRVRLQDPQDTRKLQRGQVHRVHHVLDLHRVAGLHTDILRDQPRLSGGKHSSFIQKDFFFLHSIGAGVCGQI